MLVDFRYKMYIAVICTCLGAISGCSNLSSHVHTHSELNPPAFECQQFVNTLAGEIHVAGVQDAQTHAITGLPLLHSNRLLASYAQTINAEKSELWLREMHQLALQTLLLETRNLPVEKRRIVWKQWQHLSKEATSSAELLRFCSDLLYKTGTNTSLAYIDYIKSKAKVPDHYATWQRVVGIYPVVSMFMAWGISGWHKDSTTMLQEDVNTLAEAGEIIRYTPPKDKKLNRLDEVQTILEESMQNPLGLPLPLPAKLDALFNTYAPIWEVDTLSDDDKIGSPYWPANADTPEINVNKPMVYRKVSHAHYFGKTLLQLNYIIWFPARTCTSGYDFLCGNIDGLIWRVTLDTDGRPLLYDSIHNCGCYHTFFPAKKLTPLPPKLNLDETAFIPMAAPEFQFGEPLVIRLNSVSHYLNSVYYSQQKKIEIKEYKYAHYNELRSLPNGDNNYKSLFKPNGLIQGTHRLERTVFWPMGIASAGAMRQWGTHATAFVGRRHFDDPCLLENSFQAPESKTTNYSKHMSIAGAAEKTHYYCPKPMDEEMD